MVFEVLRQAHPVLAHTLLAEMIHKLPHASRVGPPAGLTTVGVSLVQYGMG